jgi:hypothetical protein
LKRSTTTDEIGGIGVDYLSNCGVSKAHGARQRSTSRSIRSRSVTTFGDPLGQITDDPRQQMKIASCCSDNLTAVGSS